MADDIPEYDTNSDYYDNINNRTGEYDANEEENRDKWEFNDELEKEILSSGKLSIYDEDEYNLDNLNEDNFWEKKYYPS